MSINLNIQSCPICLKSLEPLQQITQICHYTSCSDCLVQWTATKITELQCGPEDTIPCVGGCGDFLTIEAICSSLQGTLERTKIEEALFQVYLNKQSDVRKCPKKGCSYAGVLQMNPDCTEPINCEVCGTMWRDKQYSASRYESLGNFAERFILQKNELFTALWKRVWAGKCPKCQTTIERNGGCEHMTCKKCKHEFCWNCSVQHPHHNYLLHQAKFVLKIVNIIILIIALIAIVYWSCRLVYAIPFVGLICDWTIVPFVNMMGGSFVWIWPMLWRFVLANAVVLLILAYRVVVGKMQKIQCIGAAVVCFGLFLYFGGLYSLISIYLAEAVIGLTVALCLYMHKKIKIYLRDLDKKFEPKFLKRSSQMLIYGQDSISMV